MTIMRKTKGTFSSLTMLQKETVGLLSIGTFLEYFDLLLYVHMAVLLNELFLPPTDPHTGALLSAFAFCSTYVLRPLGALIFGYLGDHVGRKSTIIITTGIMSLSCIIMANLPTYAEIGIIAAYMVTACRIFQGMATMGEVIGAEIYITEITKPPVQYPVVTLIAVCGVLGGTAALGMATFVTNFNIGWRNAFWFGATVAVIGAVARTRLRETPDFVNAKLKQKRAPSSKKLMSTERVNKKTALALFIIECSWPICFYFAYVYCSEILKNSFHLTSAQIIRQNFVVSMIQLASWIILMFLSYKVNPLRIVKIRLAIFMIFIFLCPYLFSNMASAIDVMLVQVVIVVFGFMGTPAIPIFYKHFPVFKRFTYATFAYALSRALVYVITSFGLVYCAKLLGDWILVAVMAPVGLMFYHAINHFVRLEQKANG